MALLTSPLRIPRPQIIRFVNSLKQSPYVDIIHIDQDKDNESWILLASREDKEWSERRLFKFYYYEGKRDIRSLN
ncbi:MAG: hypothetical protein AB4063_13510 [Crocosphaera sp.]